MPDDTTVTEEEASQEKAASQEEQAPEGTDFGVGVHVGGDVRGSLFTGSVEAYNVSAGGEARKVAPVADVTAWVDEIGATFVEPAEYPLVVEALERDRVVLLAEPGWGKTAAGGAALRATGHRPIFQLPAGIGAGALVDRVEQLCGKHGSAGFLIDAVDPEQIIELAGFELRRLRGALSGEAALVLTTHEQRQGLPHLAGLRVVAGQPPDARRVADAMARGRGLTPNAIRRVLDAVALLTEPVSPAAVLQVVDGAGDSETSPEQLAAAVDGDCAAIDEWLGRRPTAEQVAALAAAATLDRGPSADVDAEAVRLGRLLEHENADTPAEPRTFGPADRGWPAGVVRMGRSAFGTHFGRHETETVEICAPHSRDKIVRHLWTKLGGDFREPYLDWLHGLPCSPVAMVRSGAGVTAGVLFAVEPMIAERRLLYPWLDDGRWRQLACAGLALGVPAALGEDPAPARTLARRWASSSDVRRRKAATFAYGGLLGLHEPGAAAAQQLWEIGAGDGELRTLTDRALVFLLAGGRGGAYARATVLALLASKAGERLDARRAYRLLPRIVGILVARHPESRDSLAGLSSEAERASFDELARVLARAFDASPGYRSAAAALRVLLRALAEGRVDQDLVNRLIRAMKRAARDRGRLPALGTQIERVLSAEARAKGDTRDAALAVRATFYRTS